MVGGYLSSNKMGGGMSSERMQNQESYVQRNLAAEKSRMSRFKNCDGSNRYSEDQIRMKMRQDYNSGGYTKYRNDKDDYISYSHWNSNR